MGSIHQLSSQSVIQIPSLPGFPSDARLIGPRAITWAEDYEIRRYRLSAFAYLAWVGAVLAFTYALGTQ